MSFQIQHYIIGIEYYNNGQDQLLGNGKYGKIVIAKHQLVNENVLIKILEKKNLKLNRDLQNLENEIQILRQIKHQNVIQLYEILESTYNIYMIFEFGEGDDLKHKLNQCQKLNLQYICSKLPKEFLHCKLRLENIVLQNGKPKIIDFSQAIKMDQQATIDYSTIKLSYQSPEMLNSLYYEFDGQKYDIWCLGLMLYQMLQGQLPFDNITNNNDLKNKIKKSQFQINSPISQQVCSLLESMLTIDPNKRITLNELMNFLESQNLIFEDEYLKVHDDIPIHLIIKELEENQIETVNLFQQLEQNKHCTLTTCYYLIKNKLMKRDKLNKIKENLMNFENSKFNFMTKLRNSLQFTTTKSRIYQNGTRVHTENNHIRAESTTSHSYNKRSLSKTTNHKTPFMKQVQQAQKLSQTQNSFFPSYNSTNQCNLNKGNNSINNNNNKSNNINNQNFQQLGIISDGYQIYQDKLQQRLKSLLYSNNNYIIQVTNTKRRSVSQKN
ncbi:unnamed protein product (macronuclear) [Paramecium tetraurelia]|uniref:Chromosome undetermined scaffold_1, whole genome shotgun sequence n=1 Tax=Paramecium tetraurelia TaxID=5888 RepID=Q6BFS1_PARTE|nr:Protein kinase [Paramecium tetraurelia strain d4-2]XP_001423161.1 uncharacterized protein GSPATT00000198001 [Paramecium tetraurelia]CAH03499.1 Protein kinase, putative [Paramecium tetraurelia]CAK55763.1 unnamed protein product [Paramecium tetraurelia]|eukprot:XP_001423161.1 hypothetical protein (macronuclear) [Paramecium tetraurelia strain d4-2]